MEYQRAAALRVRPFSRLLAGQKLKHAHGSVVEGGGERLAIRTERQRGDSMQRPDGPLAFPCSRVPDANRAVAGAGGLGADLRKDDAVSGTACDALAVATDRQTGNGARMSLQTADRLARAGRVIQVESALGAAGEKCAISWQPL